ncbi:hypothetical protein [Nocardia asteroides]
MDTGPGSARPEAGVAGILLVLITGIGWEDLPWNSGSGPG